MTITRWDGANPAQWGAGMVDKWTDEQVASQAEWAGVGDREVANAAMHTIRFRPNGASSETVVNQLMPLEREWLQAPGDEGRVVAAGRVR